MDNVNYYDLIACGEYLVLWRLDDCSGVGKSIVVDLTLIALYSSRSTLCIYRDTLHYKAIRKFRRKCLEFHGEIFRDFEE